MLDALPSNSGVHGKLLAPPPNPFSQKANPKVYIFTTTCLAVFRGPPFSADPLSPAPDLHRRTYTYDNVFGPDSTQLEVYEAVVAPSLCEVMEGYNCTVFAYGQTGTGKTHTMEGKRANEVFDSYKDDPNAGLIPR